MLIIIFTNQDAQALAACFNAQMSVQILFLHLHPIVLVIEATEALKHTKCQQADVCTACCCRYGKCQSTSMRMTSKQMPCSHETPLATGKPSLSCDHQHVVDFLPGSCKHKLDGHMFPDIKASICPMLFLQTSHPNCLLLLNCVSFELLLCSVD